MGVGDRRENFWFELVVRHHSFYVKLVLDPGDDNRGSDGHHGC